MTDVSCAVCGRQARDDEPLLLWMLDSDSAGRTARTCPECARQNVRSIEAKLDPQWW